MVVHHQHQPALFCQVSQFARGFDTVRHRLLDEHMLAGQQRLFCRFIVQVGGQRDDHRVEFGVTDNIVEIF